MKQQKAKWSPLGKVKATTVRLTKAHPARLLILLFTGLILGIVAWVLLDMTMEPSDEDWLMPAGSEENTHAGATGDGSTVLSANVGNLDLRCLPYHLKLCRGDVEARIAKKIQELHPDVVAMQETLPDWMCDSWACSRPGKHLHDPSRRAPDPQAAGTRLYHPL